MLFPRQGNLPGLFITPNLEVHTPNAVRWSNFKEESGL